MSMFSRQDLERIRRTQVEPGPRPGGTNAIVNQVLPLAPVVARKPAVYSLDDERDSNAGTRTVEYVDADETGVRRSE